jgi:hypothetical protein
MSTATITLGTFRGTRVTGASGFGRTPAGRLASASVGIDGQRRIAGKLSGKNLWIVPTREAMLALQREARYHAYHRAPHLSGTTKSNIALSTDKRNDPPRWADVVLKPAVNEGWRYSHALDAARKRAPKGMSGVGPYARVRANAANKQLVTLRDGRQSMVQVRLAKRIRITKANAPYKFRSTNRKGKPTLNWFHGASQLTKRALRQEVAKVATGIRTGWGLIH